MTPYEEYKIYTDHQDKLFNSWFKNLIKDKDKKFNEGIWHQLRKFEPDAPTKKWSNKRLHKEFDKAIQLFLNRFK